jgi:hypothetical protein
MIKKHRNTNHLISLTTGSIESGRVDELVHYISKFTKDLLLKQNFLEEALIKSRYDCAKALIESGFEIKSPDYILFKCKIEDMEKVSKNMISLGFNFNEDIKTQLIIRILGPYKLAENPNRYNIAAKYLESGFFTQKQFEDALLEISKKHKATKWTNIVKSCIREYNLSKIL